ALVGTADVAVTAVTTTLDGVSLGGAGTNLDAQGGLVIFGQLSASRNVTTHGTSVWGDGNVYLSGGMTWTNRGTFDVRANQHYFINGDAAGARVENLGTVVKDSRSAWTTFLRRFDRLNVVDVQIEELGCRSGLNS